MTIATALQRLAYGDFSDYDGRSGYTFNSGIIAMAIAWGLWGAAFQYKHLRRNGATSLFCLCITAAPIFLNVGDNFLVSYVSLSELRGGEVELTHLYLGDNSVLLLFFSFAIAPRKLRPLIAASGALVLFALGGRSALYIFVPTILFVLMRQVSVKSFLLSATLVSAALITAANLITISDPNVQRMLISQGIAEDASAQGRELYLEVGIEALKDQITIGDASFPARTYGTIGGYIHNLLSAWQLFGLPAFALLASAMLASGLHILRNYESLRSPSAEFGILIFIYSTTSMLLVKSLSFTLFWFALGFWLPRLGVRHASRARQLAAEVVTRTKGQR